MCVCGCFNSLAVVATVVAVVAVVGHKNIFLLLSDRAREFSVQTSPIIGATGVGGEGGSSLYNAVLACVVKHDCYGNELF